MRSKPPKLIEQETSNEDQNDQVAVEIKDDGPSISAGKKNTILIIVASIILVIFCYYIFLSGIEEEKTQIVEPVIDLKPEELPKSSGEVIAPKDENEASIFDLAEIDKKEKTENLDLLEKQAKPEVPEVPELPVDSEAPQVVDISKIKDEKEKALEAQGLNGDDLTKSLESKFDSATSEDLKSRDLKIKELEEKLKQQTNQLEKDKKSIIDDFNKKEEERLQKELAIKEKEAQEDAIFEPRYSPIVVFSDRGSGGSPQVGVGQEKNIVALKESVFNKIKKTESEVQVAIIKDRTRTIAQGKMISAILETAIDTEFPGAVRGIITRDVYGESGRDVLIPKGSRLYGNYSSQIQRGQGRVNISWSRILLPSGLSLSTTLVSGDQYGRSGIVGEVDNRYNSLIANSLLTSVLAVAGTIAAQNLMSSGSNNSNQTSTTINPTQGTTTTVGNAGNQALYDVTKIVIDVVGTIMKNSINMNPVIRIPQGTRMTVIVNSDMVVPMIEKNN